jgi:hypothetical protein
MKTDLLELAPRSTAARARRHGAVGGARRRAGLAALDRRSARRHQIDPLEAPRTNALRADRPSCPSAGGRGSACAAMGAGGGTLRLRPLSAASAVGSRIGRRTRRRGSATGGCLNTRPLRSILVPSLVIATQTALFVWILSGSGPSDSEAHATSACHPITRYEVALVTPIRWPSGSVNWPSSTSVPGTGSGPNTRVPPRLSALASAASTSGTST